ncbi:MAG: M23 family metallopeptidase [Helicobacteraceae bacterium]|jgi:murein DD-endopeptidase MepM/ murein hydrolase activator NlpD|nr:M23 family metallopeptidase [Helicobacteraceae bacterium]
MNEALVSGRKCSDAKAEYFPLAKAPYVTDDLTGTNASLNTWERGQRQFGWRRDGGKRAHAGCDLYGTEGDPIFAIKAGVVTRSKDRFHSGTGVVEIDHGDYTIRYGEIKVGNRLVEEGDHVKAGQKIAKVGKCDGVNNPMLHFEQYDNTLGGDLSNVKNATFKHSNGLPYYRRLDLINPAELLNTLFKKPLPKEAKI